MVFGIFGRVETFYNCMGLNTFTALMIALTIALIHYKIWIFNSFSSSLCPLLGGF